MQSTLDWKSSEDTRDIVHIVVQALVEGRQVALPADTAYHAVSSGLKGGAAQHFKTLLESDQVFGSCLLLRSSQELLDYVPDLSPVAARIAARAWPGPLLLDLPAGGDRSLLSHLPVEMRELLIQDGRASFRVASHDAIRQALRLMHGPLVAAPLKTNNGPLRAAQSIDRLSNFSLVVDDGQTQYADYATCLQVDENRCHVTRPGVVDDAALRRAAQFVVLIVCTGNTCRSPMAEAIMRDLFVKRFLGVDQAAEKVFVASAGLNAFPGGPASIEAQETIAARGLTLSDHQSRLVTMHDLSMADLILTMTRSHRNGILDQYPELENKVHLVSGGAGDVSDPFGGPQAVYSSCANQIESYLQQWILRLDDSLFPIWS
jgi:protein-tyrosine-phosphatase/tRNA A37 threonylcarbamoyladenosine synthetase subunit TsaC/SUA5/YrdC